MDFRLLALLLPLSLTVLYSGCSSCHGDRVIVDPGGDPDLRVVSRVEEAPGSSGLQEQGDKGTAASGGDPDRVAKEGTEREKEARPRLGEVQGRVMARYVTGRRLPLRKALVELRPGNKETFTDPAGGYRFESLRPGTYRVRVTHGELREVRTAQVMAGVATQVEPIVFTSSELHPLHHPTGEWERDHPEEALALDRPRARVLLRVRAESWVRHGSKIREAIEHTLVVGRMREPLGAEPDPARSATVLEALLTPREAPLFPEQLVAFRGLAHMLIAVQIAPAQSDPQAVAVLIRSWWVRDGRIPIDQKIPRLNLSPPTGDGAKPATPEYRARVIGYRIGAKILAGLGKEAPKFLEVFGEEE